MKEFEALGLVEASASGWRRVAPVRLATVPARHPYVDAVRPAAAAPFDANRVTAWEPDPLLDPERLREAAPAIDVLHVHFGYDHLEPGQLSDWLAVVRRSAIALVVTVHDLRNPHHRDRARHDRHLGLLLAAADEVITLTPDAAAEIRRRFDRTARVLAHPSLLADTAAPAAPATTEPGLAVLHLKSLRTNVMQAADLIAAAGRGARRARGRLRVDGHEELSRHPEFPGIRRAAIAAGADLHLHERFTDAELFDYLGRAHACILPYRFGTHSGWLELCRDLGTRVVAPSCGYYGGAGGQWPQVISYSNDELQGLEPDTLTRGVERALREPAPQPADVDERFQQLQQLRRVHGLTYRRLSAS